VVDGSCRTRGPSGGLPPLRHVVPLIAQWARMHFDVVNDALGSLLLRANEVIDQVPMSACGARLRHADRCCRCLFVGEDRK
jgi:hypothetical protein